MSIHIYIFQDEQVVSQFALANLIISADHNNPRFTISQGKYFDVRRRFDIVKYVEPDPNDEDSLGYYTWLKRCRANRIINSITNGLVAEVAGIAEDWTAIKELPTLMSDSIYHWNKSHV